MSSYWLFATIWLVAAATPGADTMLLLSTSLSTGWKSAVSISLGISSAKIVLLTATFFGLTALLTAAPQLFVILKIFGCAFLLWRALQLWRAKQSKPQKSGTNFLANFSLAFSIGVSNPQALLFYIAVVPQVSQSTNPWVLNAIILIGFSLISAFYISLAKPLSGWIQRGNHQHLVKRIVSVIFVVLALTIALR